MISLPVSTTPPDAPAPADTASAPGRFAEIALRVGGVVIAVGLAIATAIWEAVLTTWYVIIGGHVVRLPVAPLLAIVCNLALFWFVRKVTGKAALVIFPALAWLAIMVIAGNVTSDGDLIVTSTWVGVSTIILGTVAWAVPSYRSVLAKQTRSLAGRQAAGPSVGPSIGQSTKPPTKTTQPVKTKQPMKATQPMKQSPNKPANSKSTPKNKGR